MNSEKELISQIDGLIHPRSIAIVGLPRGMKTGKLFLIALQDQGFSGPIYPVNPSTAEIDGLKTYPSLSDIPGHVDLAIVLVPQKNTIHVLRECVEKGVKGAVLFTAGYKETGSEEGRMMEKEITDIAKAAGIRLIGPNGMGIYSPSSGLSFFPQLSKTSGPVGFISHSGSLTNILGRIAPKKGVFFSKMLSLGNECDLASADFLTYLGEDDNTGLIGAYIEGVKDGGYFFRSLKKASHKKPVILWKVGLTPEGSRATASHTGAMAGSKEVWEGMVRQAGGIPVVGIEELIDSLMGFALLPRDLGKRLAVISGPGGTAVAAAEACGREGLFLAELSDSTRTRLGQFVPATGTSLRNPIDVGMSASLDIEIYLEAAKAAVSDKNVDAVLVAGTGMDPETNRTFRDGMIQVHRDSQKPFSW